MTFEYAINSKEFMLTGKLEVPRGTTIAQATFRAGLKAAKLAELLALEWDPFNVQIAVKHIKSTPKPSATN